MTPHGVQGRHDIGVFDLISEYREHHLRGVELAVELETADVAHHQSYEYARGAGLSLRLRKHRRRAVDTNDLEAGACERGCVVSRTTAEVQDGAGPKPRVLPGY